MACANIRARSCRGFRDGRPRLNSASMHERARLQGVPKTCQRFGCGKIGAKLKTMPAKARLPEMRTPRCVTPGPKNEKIFEVSAIKVSPDFCDARMERQILRQDLGKTDAEKGQQEILPRLLQESLSLSWLEFGNAPMCGRPGRRFVQEFFNFAEDRRR